MQLYTTATNKEDFLKIYSKSLQKLSIGNNEKKAEKSHRKEKNI